MSQQEKVREYDFSRRLREAREILGITQENLGKQWEVEGNYIYILESGKRGFPKKWQTKVLDLEEEVRKKFDSRNHPLFPPGSMAKTGFKPAAGTENLLSKSDSVSREGPLNEVRTDPMVYRVKRKVPVVGYVAGANFLSDRSFNYADIANQIEEYIETTSRDPNAVALIVEGDSMEPQICAGDKIVVAPNSEPRNGKPVVARLAKEGSVVIKIFHRSGPEGKTIRLESRNKEYSDIVKDISEFRFIYPVVKVERDTL